jgi:uncharacterized protein (DUF427 family)
LEESTTTTHCPWKGDASYFHVVVDEKRADDAAWFYPETTAAAQGIRSYIAFWKGVVVTGSNAPESEIQPPAPS